MMGRRPLRDVIHYVNCSSFFLNTRYSILMIIILHLAQTLFSKRLPKILDVF